MVINALTILMLSALVGSMTGLHFSKRYKARQKYFADLIDFISVLKAEIAFRRENVISVIERKSCEVNPLLSEQLKQLKNSYSSGNLNISRGYLSKEEHSRVGDFMRFIGSTDADSQISGLESNREIFSVYEKKHSVNYAKYGTSIIKLGMLGGLGLGILLV